jgi:hypothetical protein
VRGGVFAGALLVLLLVLLVVLPLSFSLSCLSTN